MRMFLKIVAILVVIVIAAVAFLMVRGSQRPNKVYAATVSVPDVPVDSMLLARGQQISNIWGCRECHGQDLAGMDLIPAGNPVVQVSSTNLTSGAGGVGSTFTDTDWIRAIRYGIHADGTPIYMMPSRDWTTMSDYDVAAIVAYVKTIPPVDKEHPRPSMGFMGKILAGLGEFNMWEAEHIDFSAQPNNSVVPGPTAEYGAYITQNCSGCHRPNFKGGPSLQDPSFPSPPDISATGESSSWTKEQFLTALTTGVRPDGRQMEPLHMPWTAFSHLTPMEQEAVFAFIRTVQ